MPPTVLTLEDLTSQIKGFQSEVQNQVRDLLKNGASETDAKVKALADEQKKMNDYLAKVEDQIKQYRASAVPGLGDQHKKTPFDLGMFVKALYLQKIGESDPWKDAGFEKEAIDEYMKKRDANAAGGAAGAYLIPQEISGEVVSLAIARTPILNMGTTIIPNLTADLGLNRVTGRPTGYWVGENSAPTKDETTFGQVWMRPKKVGAFTKISNRLIYQSRGVADKVIRSELSIAMSLKMNEGLTVGKGTEYQPKGIFMQPNTTASSIDYGTSGKRFRMTDLATMEMDLDVANELIDNGKFGYLFRPEVKAGIKQERVVMYSGATADAGLPVDVMNPLMSNARIKEMLGYDFKTTTQIGKTEALGTSTTCSKVAFGNWEFFYVGMWRDLVIKVSEHASDAGGKSAFTEDQLYVVAFQEIDCELIRPTAFTIQTGAETLKSKW